MLSEEDYKTEKIGYESGNNPHFGRWEQKFDFPPVSYSNKSELKQEFKRKLQSELSVKYVFTQQIQLQITLYLNEERMLTTAEYGDLDNYAKSICDALKGKGGLIIDDCQIQRLDICWIDTPHASHFEIKIQSTPDEYCYKELLLYEMSNGLYYPISTKFWSKGKMLDMSIDRTLFTIVSYSKLTQVSKQVQHHYRQSGNSQLHAYSDSKYLSPITLGFHKTRIIDSGYEIITKNSWEKELKIWLETTEDCMFKQTIIEQLDITKQTYNSKKR